MLFKTKLNNGLTVASDYTTEVDSATIKFAVKTGSRSENIKTNGISHFLEHMAFKGTKERTALKLANDFEDIGASFNAYTSHEVTCYYSKTLKEYTEKSFEILADLFQNSTFTEEELEKERNVILQELAMTNDSPDDVIDDYFQATAFPNQAYGRTILGSEENIKNFTRQNLLDYIDKYYTNENIYIFSVGNLEHSKLIELVNKYITKTKNNQKIEMEKAVYNGGYFLKQKDLEQALCILGFEGLSYNHKDYYKMYILNNILGGSMSSRLFQEIREKRGLCYNIYSTNSSTLETGTFEIGTAINPENTNQTIDAIMQELNKFVQDGISTIELNRAKVKIKSTLLMQLENMSNRGSMLLSNVIFKNELPSKQEIIDQIESTTKENVVAMLKNIIKTKPTVALYGDLENIYNYEEIQGKIVV